MSTHQVNMFGQSMVPDSSGLSWFEPYDVFATNDVWKGLVLRLANPASTQHGGVYGFFNVPQNYVGNAAAVIKWTTTATTGNACFRYQYRSVAGNNANSMDQAGTQQNTTGTFAAPGAAHRLMQSTITLTAANFAAGNMVEYLFERDDNSAADTIAADVVVFEVDFQYTDV